MAREEGSGPEIDAREKAINNLKSVRFQTGSPAGRLGVGEALTPADGGELVSTIGVVP